MIRPATPVLVLVAALLVTGFSTVPASAFPWSSGSAKFYPGVRKALAKAILSNPRIALLDYHVSGYKDQATAFDNMVQTAEGQPARRSYYGRSPGDSTKLDPRMLRALETLTREGYSFRITELAGGSHSSTSRHYDGVAFDIDYLNGRKVTPSHPLYRRFMQRCRELGATETFGPGYPGHASHVHIAWPREQPM
jgi:hypothetical protein